MDSVSQAALGAVVAVVTTRGKAPVRAMIYGAGFATAPDLDVLQSYGNDLLNTVKHRTWTHSWLLHLAVSPILGILFNKMDKSWSLSTWMVMIFVVLTTHSGLDALTIYGTGLFWPVNQIPVMGGSIFIIDPLFTLPLVFTGIYIFRKSRNNEISVGKSSSVMFAALIGIAVSGSYLLWGLYAKTHIEALASTSLDKQELNYSRLVATPTPFNSVLWRIVAMDDDEFHEGFHSLLDSDGEIIFHTYPRNRQLVSSIEGTDNFVTLNEFNHGYYAIEQINNQIIASDLRMGMEPFYFFQFVMATTNTANQQITPIIPIYAKQPFEESRFFRWIWQRFTTEEMIPLPEFK